jgi:hypothetical protein
MLNIRPRTQFSKNLSGVNGNYASQASYRLVGYNKPFNTSWSLGPLKFLTTQHGGLTMNILALDIGKYNTVFCYYNCNNGKHDFGKVKTTPQAIHDLIVEICSKIPDL